MFRPQKLNNLQEFNYKKKITFFFAVLFLLDDKSIHKENLKDRLFYFY